MNNLIDNIYIELCGTTHKCSCYLKNNAVNRFLNHIRNCLGISYITDLIIAQLLEKYRVSRFLEKYRVSSLNHNSIKLGKENELYKKIK